MRIYAPLLAWLVLHAHAASINNKPDKRIDDLENVDLDNDSESGVINSNGAGIPVKVIEDAAKTVDVNSNGYIPADDDASSNIKRFEIDLENPGPPQRQEHETQNPENFSDLDKAIVAVQRKIEETKNVFTEEIKEVSKNFETLFTEKEDLPKMLQSLETLKSTFSKQIAKLDESIKTNLYPDSIEAKSVTQETVPQGDYVKSDLKIVEDNFKRGVGTLNEGVELLTIIREEDEVAEAKDNSPKDSPSTTTSTGATGAQSQPPGYLVLQFFENFQHSVLNSLTSLSTRVQNVINPNGNKVPSNSNGSPGSNSGGSGNLSQGINIPNVFPNQGQPLQDQTNQQASTAQSAPIAQNPSVLQQLQTSVQNFLNPNQNIVPNQNSAGAQPTVGPLQNIIQNNPIRKGIQQAVQWLQNGTTPNQVKDTPREPADNSITVIHNGSYQSNNDQGNNDNGNAKNADEPKKADTDSDTLQGTKPKEPVKEAISENTE